MHRAACFPCLCSIEQGTAGTCWPVAAVNWPVHSLMELLLLLLLLVVIR
jgi:hypothetical protein